MIDAFIGLGSNLGDRLANLASALEMLEDAEGLEVAAVSHAYESEPWGVADQPPFANAVAWLRMELEGDDLLDVLQDVEERMGRKRDERFGPRTIDLDVLLVGDEEWDSPRLVVPHPRMAEREFVVRPLLEVWPDARYPDGTPVSPERAVAGRILGELGPVPGWEERSAEAAHRELPAEPGPSRVPRPPRGEQWVAVAAEAGEGADLLFYEAVLRDNDVPVVFDPNRPNEGFLYPHYTNREVRLMVPGSMKERAEALIAEAEAAPVDEAVMEAWEAEEPDETAPAEEGPRRDEAPSAAAEDDDTGVPEGWTSVRRAIQGAYMSQDAAMGLLVQEGLLRSAGIPAMVHPRPSLAGPGMVHPAFITVVRLLVPRERAAEARRVLKERS